MPTILTRIRPTRGTNVSPAATIVITTRNRKDDLAKAIRSAVEQEGEIEILVVDDCSCDGTPEFLRERFPDVRVITSERAEGYIRQRNRAADLASASILVSIDDDAVFSSSSTVLETVSAFDRARVGAVAMPHVNVNQSPAVITRAPDGEDVWVTSSYIGTAHAVRRDLFVTLGGYRETLVHQSEEADFCLRLLAAGYVTRLGVTEPILHYESPRRNVDRGLFYSRRNDVLHGWHNVPMPYLVARLTKVTAHSAAIAVRSRRPHVVARGLLTGYRDAARARAAREPVPRSVYQIEHLLRKHGPRRLATIESVLPPIPEVDVAASMQR